MSKLRYFLNRFKGIEWSGPAWYSEKFDKDGFPTDVVLEYWLPLDLGSGGHTEWDGKKLLGKTFAYIRKLHPEIGKEWVQGNIHSHHNMGAYFSDTDDKQLQDGAFKDMFYYSLVVSNKSGQELAFAMSYVDQYNRIHLEECDDITTNVVNVTEPEWKAQANAIQKAAKKIKKTAASYAPSTTYYSGYGQSTLFKDDDKKKQRKERAKKAKAYQARYTNGW